MASSTWKFLNSCRGVGISLFFLWFMSMLTLRTLQRNASDSVGAVQHRASVFAYQNEQGLLATSNPGADVLMGDAVQARESYQSLVSQPSHGATPVSPVTPVLPVAPVVPIPQVAPAAPRPPMIPAAATAGGGTPGLSPPPLPPIVPRPHVDIAARLRAAEHVADVKVGPARAASTVKSFRCKGNMQELYSAAWFATVGSLKRLPYEPYRLDKGGTNMEGASYLIMAGHHKVKSTDMLDLFIEHLSWYERRLMLGKVKNSGLVDHVRTAFANNIRRNLAHTMATRDHNPLRASPRADVVAVMPFFSAGHGVGHSDLDLRRAYLNATIWPLADLIPNIVVSVCHPSDLAYVRSIGFPFYDVLMHSGKDGCGSNAEWPLSPTANADPPGPGGMNLPDPRKLGVATLLATNRALHGAMEAAGSVLRRNTGWDQKLKFVWYTESDQVLRVRHLDHWLDLVERDNNTLVLPHRALPVPLADEFPGISGGSGDLKRGGFSWEQAPVTFEEVQRNSGLPNNVMHRGTGHAPSCCFPSMDHACRNLAEIQSGAEELEVFQYSTEDSPPTTTGLWPRGGGGGGPRDTNGTSSFAIVAGEGNFWKMLFRKCDFRHGGVPCEAGTVIPR